jgi:hypothetical protein
VLADVKTGGAFREAILQLAGYSLCTLVQPRGLSTVYPMPTIDRYVILQVTENGVRPIDVTVGVTEHMAFLAALELYTWAKATKGRL